MVFVDPHLKVSKWHITIENRLQIIISYLPKNSDIGDIVRWEKLKIYKAKIAIIVKFQEKLKNYFWSFCKKIKKVSQTKLTEDIFQWMLAMVRAKVRAVGLLLWIFSDWMMLLIKDDVSFIPSTWIMVYIACNYQTSNYQISQIGNLEKSIFRQIHCDTSY